MLIITNSAATTFISKTNLLANLERSDWLISFRQKHQKDVITFCCCNHAPPSSDCSSMLFGHWSQLIFLTER
jgi:hypothetical protein